MDIIVIENTTTDVIEVYEDTALIETTETIDTVEYPVTVVESIEIVTEGPQGPKPNHEVDGTSIRFENPNGTWGEWMDLQGLPPEHEIEGSALRFKNPDGSWGEWITIGVDGGFF